MYRYIWEVPCFSRSFESDKILDTNLQRGARRIISTALGIGYNDVHLVRFSRNPESSEVRYEAKASVEKNYEFFVALDMSSLGSTIVSLETRLSRLDPVYLRDFQNQTESIVSNIFREFAKNSFYTDVISELKLKYEDLSRKIFEQLEALFHLEAEPAVKGGEKEPQEGE
jgi:hypothetical protein